MIDYFWLIPLIPGASAFVLIIFGRWLRRKAVSWLACLSVFASFLISLLSFLSLIHVPADRLPVVTSLFPWIVSGAFRADVSFQFDPLSSIMALVVSGVGFLIHVYSVGYMGRDRSYTRYFACLNLFTFAMLILVLSSNIVLMFVGWEGVGLCSYLLIGFWFEKPRAASAGKKAFLVNRVGDAAFLIGVFLLVLNIGSGDFRAVNEAVQTGGLSVGLATLVALLLFAGATGKSAQIPLYIWLPDAMEGPTPVSALIHAATMVTAGVYMVSRLSAVFSLSGVALEVVGLIGGMTAVFAATMALTQNDIKRILAYSTISQIGYMFVGCGAGAYAAGMFHLFTHAFFKSLLFLGAGSVMHALSGELDIRKMGGLRRHLPLTSTTFLIGAMAIAGVPFLSGFFSKDAILTRSFASGQYVVWGLGIVGAVLTAFYMFRLVFLTFFGQERLSPEAKAHLHESPPVMTVPLAILAFFSIAAGYVGLPVVLGENADLFGRFLAPVLPPVAEAHLGLGTEWVLILVSVAAALAGISLAYSFYLKSPRVPHQLVARFPRVYKLLLNKYYVDEAYNAVFVRPLVRGSELVYDHFDLKIIDGAVNGTASAAGFTGRMLSLLQSGLIKDYALAFLLGVAVFIGWLLM